MSVNWNKINRKTHYWGSMVCAIPVFIIIVSGSLLLLKKEFTWIQPATVRGVEKTPSVSFEEILHVAMGVEQAEITSWGDIDRLDVRPNKGVVKIRANNQWEIQLDHATLKILQVAYRRSDFIEALHDGSFFHKKVTLMVFLPAAIVLLVLWLSGMYLFVKTVAKRTAKKNRKKQIVAVN
ncbi:hypothetical protein A9Q89_07515 [Gammaproteobacteria bacterium 53_120_T64]|nr:hypothetical protein A9Q89_07515 [Gammaproteobacteria bacterium 53_120_T64]